MLKEVLEQNHWMGKVDLKDAYLTVPIHHSHTGYLKFSLEGKGLQVFMPSIRTSISSQNIHKDPKASSQFPEESRCEDVSIHRRHSSDSRHKGKSQATATPSEFNPNSPRVRSKYKEVHTRTHSTNRVFGHDDRLRGNENLSTKGKDRENQKRMQVCPAPHPHSPTDVTSNRTFMA